MRRRTLLDAVVLLAPLLGCRAELPLDDSAARAAMKQQAERLAQVSLAEDHESAADLAHPGLIRLAGGREKYLAALRRASTEVKTQGFLLSMHVDEPTHLLRVGKKAFGIVPTSLVMSAQERKVRAPGLLLGESTDGGRTWRFLSSGGFGGDRDKARQIIPDLPDTLPVEAPPAPTSLD
jgi:hypothetical protein